MIRLIVLTLLLTLSGCAGRQTYVFMPSIPNEARNASWCWRCWQDEATLRIEAYTGARVVWPNEDSR